VKLFKVAESPKSNVQSPKMSECRHRNNSDAPSPNRKVLPYLIMARYRPPRTFLLPLFRLYLRIAWTCDLWIIRIIWIRYLSTYSISRGVGVLVYHISRSLPLSNAEEITTSTSLRLDSAFRSDLLSRLSKDILTIRAYVWLSLSPNTRRLTDLAETGDCMRGVSTSRWNSATHGCDITNQPCVPP
jgi:hypothetical protein